MKRVSAKPLFILLGFVAVGCALHAAQLRQPRFQGRTLTEWLMDFDDRKGNSNATVVAAIRQIGTNALPIILEFIRPEDSRFYPNDPTDEDASLRACVARALDRFGTDAKVAIRALLNSLGDSNVWAGADALSALRRIHPGTAARALPEFLKRFKTMPTNVRINLTPDLLESSDDPRAMSILIENLRDKDRRLRYWTTFLLGGIGKSARPAAPELSERLNDSEKWVRVFAAIALREIGEEPAKAVAALVATLQDDDPYLRRAAAEHLGGFGAKAKSAVPAVLSAWGSVDSGDRFAVADALRQIDPEQRRKPL